MTNADLIRFVDAQDQVYQQVVEELGRGRKETHCMWFIFPQLAGLGRLQARLYYRRGRNIITELHVRT
jgi:uncharacterized protein (DUF1810 family)